jgi:hypothetical protein
MVTPGLRAQSAGDLSHLLDGGSIRALDHNVTAAQAEPDLLAVGLSCPERQLPILTEPYRSSPARRGVFARVIFARVMNT